MSCKHFGIYFTGSQLAAELLGKSFLSAPEKRTLEQFEKDPKALYCATCAERLGETATEEQAAEEQAVLKVAMQILNTYERKDSCLYDTEFAVDNAIETLRSFAKTKSVTCAFCGQNPGDCTGSGMDDEIAAHDFKPQW